MKKRENGRTATTTSQIKYEGGSEETEKGLKEGEEIVEITWKNNEVKKKGMGEIEVDTE